MKNYLIAVLFLSAGLINICCSDLPVDSFNPKNGIKVSRIDSPKNKAIPDSLMDKFKIMFKKNNLSLDDLQISRYSIESWGDSSTYIFCDQYWKGIRILFREVRYFFSKQGNCYRYDEKTAINTPLNTSNITSPSSAGRLVFDCINSESSFENVKDAAKESGLNAELCWYDLNSGQGKQYTDFVLAWRVTVNEEIYSSVQGLVRADNGRLIYFDNGIRED